MCCCSGSTSVCRGRRFHPLHSFLIQRRKGRKKAKSHPCISECTWGRAVGAETREAEEKSHTEVSLGGSQLLRLSRFRMLCVRWYPIASAHSFAIWIKLPFICIIKTFTYIKYQPFLSTGCCLKTWFSNKMLFTEDFSRFFRVGWGDDDSLEVIWRCSCLGWKHVFQ